MINEFEGFLLKSGKVSENKIKYYVYWVRLFLKHCKYELKNISTEQIKQYLGALEADRNIADWQAKQAADAVIIYVEQFLANPLKLTVTGPDTTAGKLSSS